MARQGVDMLARQLPTDQPRGATKTMENRRCQFATGHAQLSDDLGRTSQGLPPAGTEDYVVGKNIAATPGKVVYRNRLIELIQYSPTTDKVQPGAGADRCPPDHGSTTSWTCRRTTRSSNTWSARATRRFRISWKPYVDEATLCMDDYLALGVEAALDAINAIVPKQKVHAAGYCLGGTLLSIANAAMARDGQDRLASMTLFTAQTDFTEPGQLALFIDDSQLAMLEAQMRETGYLQAGQMVGAFQLLNSYDMLWSRMVSEYLLGERGKMIDLMAWNAGYHAHARADACPVPAPPVPEQRPGQRRPLPSARQAGGDGRCAHPHLLRRC